ncbi:winged helix-turn-helix domain-containing protein, partial [Lysobacter sp. A3-1-A15]
MEPSGHAGEGGWGGERYRFGPVVVDPAAHTLTRDGHPIAVEPKAFAVLLALLARPGELIHRDDLLDRVWGHRHVTPGVLTRAIGQLRTALGDDAHHPRYIQTQHALGYRFIAALEGADPAPAAPAATPVGAVSGAADGPEQGRPREPETEPEPDDAPAAAAPPL